MSVICHCGGETQLEHFAAGSRPVEWFLRCAACQCMSEARPTADEARDLPIAPAFPVASLERPAG